MLLDKGAFDKGEIELMARRVPSESANELYQIGFR